MPDLTRFSFLGAVLRQYRVPAASAVVGFSLVAMVSAPLLEAAKPPSLPPLPPIVALEAPAALDSLDSLDSLRSLAMPWRPFPVYVGSWARVEPTFCLAHARRP
jgi:hypothetical protein